MNIPARPSIWWSFLVDEGDEWGEYRSSANWQWSDLSDPTTLDPGFSVYLTRQKGDQLSCGFEGEKTRFLLQPPDDVQFFSFTRYAQAVSVLVDLPPKWLYTVFGYALENVVVIARLSCPGTGIPIIENLYLPRPVSFPW